jgi:hypothetical protein
MYVFSESNQPVSVRTAVWIGGISLLNGKQIRWTAQAIMCILLVSSLNELYNEFQFMDTDVISPKIESLKWGELKTGNHTYKDAKLFPGGSREWDWTETGMHHVPGIQPADVKELFEHDAEIIILSKGFNERLQTSGETKSFLDEKGCKYFILQSEKAATKYNELCRKEEPVGALIHSTC